ncbi:MAG: GerAB/ArcD/ProY family transporter [Desulfotomaculum sp.]|nr:GerAB/ArcD/ProY family transporter [Desulfotomaculum sp.]
MAVDAFRLEAGKISARQLMFIIITFIISTADIFLPAIVAQQAGRDSWISVVVANAEAMVVAAVALSLGLRFPQLTLVGICQKVLGKWNTGFNYFNRIFFITAVRRGGGVWHNIKNSLYAANAVGGF